ncbi:MAG TPA: HAD-IB family phosphatase [Candidatus Thalassarchaeaceae archaeon]|nr:hypothetical protein [Euryarchaeota archaeon]DAC44001.1 MAG TPA: HAD family hydrolase [Candidatus Poseidoniales archaeon]HII89938.1 HAD-IB family phosphatase [Candidatus Thalassarchaeaceae archaeon]|tara:strand:+ start:3030 stop:3701 length:672 start_codon:yes stop_codon:yes gene_type:complete
MVQPLAVAFDCDGVLADNGSSWQAIHDAFKTENKQMFAKFIAREIDDDEFMADDVAKWMEARGRIHKDDIARCYGGIRLMPGAREVVGRLQERGVMVAIVSSGVDIFVGMIAAMLKVDDWVANGFDWDEDGWMNGPAPSRVLSFEKGIMVEKLRRINDLSPDQIVSVGDSGSDLSMMIQGSSFIGFNPTGTWSVDAFEEAGVPIVKSRDLRDIWPILMGGEEF